MTKRIGLTGGIACGKSEVLARLKQHHIPVLDTDHVAHELLKSGNTVFEKIVTRFGESILDMDGDINRSSLGRIVFGDEKARKDLNALMHPEIGVRWREWLKMQTSPLAVVIIPLLFEIGFEKEFDGVVCVWSPEALMLERLQKRNLTENEAKQRMKAQMPVDLKAEKSNWILHNNLTLEHLHTQVDEWVEKMIN